MRNRTPWFGIRKPLSPTQELLLKAAAFLLPLGVWCLVSYCPYVWHPMVRVDNGGGSTFLREGTLIERQAFAAENGRLEAAGKARATGKPANPIFLPAPHEVATALYTAFTTEPARRGDPWLHESLAHSVTIIFWGFASAAIIGVPIGVLCGTFNFFARITEPFVDFIRYMPAPAFGALAVAVMGINDAPKIAIIFIGTFFQMVLVVANTTRLLDTALLEAAQTLGAKPRRLLTHVIVPGILPNLYNDMRILLGWAWTYLIVAELIGASSGISYFINQQGKYRHYDNVYAGIVLIGLIGLATDQIMAILLPQLFPWTPAGARAKRWGVGRLFARTVNALGSPWDERLPWRHARQKRGVGFSNLPASRTVPAEMTSREKGAEPDVRIA
ncbi:MAG TPA: ABC transporter permease subunit [Tepidisphaeraceae bacterium]|nr:ABC transporter permease subunit [Tepidisphaeraceae bacterium]